MSNLNKTYFLAPTWDYPPPPRGPIRLGNFIASPGRPVPALYSAPSSLTTSQATAIGHGDVEESFQTEKKTVTWSRDKLRAGKFGVWTEFLSFLGLGVDVGVGWDTKSEETYTFKTMTTTISFPTLTYLTTAVSSPTLSRHLRKSRFFPRDHALYVITAIKSVSGAACKTSSSRGRESHLGVKLDSTLLTGATAPVSLGPSISGEKKSGDGGGFEGGDDFVFAYGLRRVLVRERKKGEREVLQEDWTKGAMYLSTGDAEDGTESPFEVVGLEQEDVEAAELGGEVMGVVLEGEEEGLCVVGRKA